MTDKNNPDDSKANDVPVDPTPPSEDDADGGGVLSPEELDVSDSEYVEQLDDSGRYVVSPGGGPPNVPDSTDETENTGGGTTGDGGAARDPSVDVPSSSSPGGGPVSPEAARTLLADELKRTESRYGVDIVARFDGDTVRHRTVSNDVVATFENLVQWYAQHVTDNTPADEVIEILLNESSFVDPTTPNLAELLDAHDLEKSDSIEELVEAIRVESER